MGLENPLHIAILLLLVLLLFGAKRLPEMGRSLGDGMRGFKEAISGAAPNMLSGESSERDERPARSGASAAEQRPD